MFERKHAQHRRVARRTDGHGIFHRQRLSSAFHPSFLSRSYQRPEDGLGSDEAEGLVERQDGAAEWAGG